MRRIGTAGRLVDRFGARRMTIAGLVGMAGGCFVLSFVPAIFGLAGYLPPRRHLRSAQPVAHLGLITGASVMGALFALASAASDVTTAQPDAVAAGMRITFVVAASLIVAAVAVATVTDETRKLTIATKPDTMS